jgi:hypothetical protein
MGFLDDMEGLGRLGKSLLNGLDDDTERPPRLTLTCPCGEHREWDLLQAEPDQVVAEVRKHLRSCTAAKARVVLPILP